MQFLKLLLPHFGHLLAAVAAALAVAVLNIQVGLALHEQPGLSVYLQHSFWQIPQLLGNVVNVVAEFARSDGGSGNAVDRFLSEIKGPAFHMAKLYVAQSVMTFAYIYALSCVGKGLRFLLGHTYINCKYFSRREGGGEDAHAAVRLHLAPGHRLLRLAQVG